MELNLRDTNEAIVELEATRIQLFQRQKRLTIASFAVLTLCITVILLGFVELGIGALFVALITLTILFSTFSNKKKQFALDVKSNIVSKLLNGIGHDIELFPSKGISRGEFNGSQLFSQESDRHKTEDLVTGKYHHTTFYFAEVHAEYKSETTDSKGRQKVSYHHIFDGIVLVAEFNKKLQGQTIVRPKDNWALTNFLTNFFHSFRGNVIQLENEVFMQQFVTYGNNQIEARYVLTPLLMERILELERKFNKRINLSFFSSRVYMAIPFREDFFDPSLNYPLNATQFAEDIQLVESMLDVIDALDLNVRIWEN